MDSPLRQINSRSLAFILLAGWKALGKSWKTLGKSSFTAFKQQVDPQTFLLPHRDVEPQPALVAGPDLPD